MDPMRGQGGIQMLLTAEREARNIVDAARDLKTARLRQARDEAEKEAANYRSQLESEYQKSIVETTGSKDSTAKRLEAETESKIQILKETASKVTADIVSTMLIKHITTVRP
ncbi:hypothetical protein M569_16055 [Genlisea aurea]|uniref:V-type proton ATPase subunit G n=1 Tax=Genlisea aurea TaxID=192259 RepID=S8D7R0_9LAMI|nr:hypothetical protein M569_16055 [Genlisea aurea]